MKTLRNVLLCAWVLWSFATPQLPQRMESWWVTYTDSEAECKAEKARFEAAAKAHSAKGPLTFSYGCLPVGLSPRDKGQP